MPLSGPRCVSWADQPVFRAVLIRLADDAHRFVLTNHHIVMDGWSLPILVRELFAAYGGARLPAAGPYRRFVTWLAGRDGDGRPRGLGAGVGRCVTPPPWWARPAGPGWGGARWPRFRCARAHRRGRRAGPRPAHHRQHRAPRRLRPAAVRVDRPHDVVFGTTVSGRPAELPGAEAMVGLLINTVPVRATITATTTTADLLAQLHHAHNHTLDHQHLALSDIHRITGHEQLFDTLFVYENYPIDTTAPLGVDGLAITEFSTREYNHYPLAIQALPGTELGLRIEYDTEVFDTAAIDTLFARFTRAAGRHDHRPHRRAVIDRCARRRRTRPPRWVGQPGGVDRARPRAGLDPGAVRHPGRPRPRRGRGQLRAAVDDLSRTRRTPPTGSPTCSPTTAPAPDSAWRC